MQSKELKKNKLFIEFIEDRETISKDRIRTYTVALAHFFTLVNKTPEEYINETKMKQLSYLKDTEIINENGEKETVKAYIAPDIEKGDLYTDFKSFYSSQKEKKLEDRTIDSYIAAIRTFLSKNGVKLPRKKRVDWTTNPKKLLKWEKIRRAINKTSTRRDEALFSFMASSGLRSKDVRNLKIKDFLKALDLENIEDLFKLNDNRVAYFEFKPSKTKKRGFWCKTCCTPYSVNIIINYLKYERKNEEINYNSYLFVTNSNNRKISSSGFKQIFVRMNKKLYKEDLEWLKGQLEIWQYDKQKGLPHERGISPEKYEEEINDISKFHAHGLRAYFINTISSHCGNLKIVACMEGHKSPVDTDISYTNFDRGVIVHHYFSIIPYLSFEKTETNILDDEATKKIKKELKERDKKIEKLEMSNNELEKLKKVITPETLEVLEKLKKLNQDK